MITHDLGVIKCKFWIDLKIFVKYWFEDDLYVIFCMLYKKGYSFHTFIKNKYFHMTFNDFFIQYFLSYGES